MIEHNFLHLVYHYREFSRVVDELKISGPVLITKWDDKKVVMLSIEDYEALMADAAAMRAR